MAGHDELTMGALIFMIVDFPMAHLFALKAEVFGRGDAIVADVSSGMQLPINTAVGSSQEDRQGGRDRVNGRN